MKKTVWVPVVVGALCAIVFFFVGKSVGASGAASSARSAFASSTRGGFAGRAGAGGGFAAGQIVSLSANSMTIQLANGNSEVVFYSSSTQIVAPQTVPVSSLKAGSQVMVGGTTNSDGSVTASTIQVRTGSSTFGGGPRTQGQ